MDSKMIPQSTAHTFLVPQSGDLNSEETLIPNRREGEAKPNSARQRTSEGSVGNRSFRETSRSAKSPRQPHSSRDRPQSSKESARGSSRDRPQSSRESARGKKKEMGVLKRHGSLIAEDEGRIVTINCGGVKHQTLIHTLRKFPGTLLADLAKGPEKDSPGGALYTKGEVCDLCSVHVLVTMCLLQSILFIITHVFARG